VRTEPTSSAKASKKNSGFALAAAKYGNSGVMTFLVNHQVAVFQKNLGASTARTAAGMTAYNPDNTWQRVTDAGAPPSGAEVNEVKERSPCSEMIRGQQQ
jgi:hypothetical protein